MTRVSFGITNELENKKPVARTPENKKQREIPNYKIENDDLQKVAVLIFPIKKLPGTV